MFVFNSIFRSPRFTNLVLGCTTETDNLLKKKKESEREREI